MLFIKNSCNLDYLYNSLISDIKSVWTNPFDAPTIICSDIKVEQRFKLAWLNSGDSDSILMNLKTARLESFIFEAIAGGLCDDSKIWYERLDDNLIKAGIIQKLISESNGIKYYKTLESDAVTNFIENKDGTVNEVHLNNFAGKIAQLFSEYLSTRNDNFESGIFAKWNSGQSYFDFKNDEKKAENIELENWQRKLFTDVIGGDFFTIPVKDNGFKVKYVTLSELISINKKLNDGKLRIKINTKNIFLFGFSGMGQEYRELLKFMSENSDSLNLHVYIQASELNINEASNILTKKWNKSGNENLLLWKDSKWETDKNTNDSEKYKDDTLLKTIQNQILNDELNSPDVLSKLKDGSFTVTNAPSKLKEIEALHSSICSTINKKRQWGEQISYSDFIVLSPNIQEYRVPVKQVFEQNEKYKTEVFPYVPYVMADYSAESSAIAEALGVFVNILENKFLSRTDLFSLLRNAAVCEARNITDVEINAWSNWVSELNAFRDRISSKSEWEKICRRLMLSYLTDKPVAISDTEEVYIPYSNIETENSESLYKFIDAVESLEKFISDFSEKNELEDSDLDKILEFLESWLKLPKECSEGLKGEHIVYSEVKNEIHNHKLLFNFGFEKINAKCFFISLKESAKASKGSSTNLFTGGITFGNFALNRTIPAKYVYIIGLGSKVFPGIDLKQSLDLRSKVDTKPGDETVVSRNLEAFLCQLMATKEELHLSYVNKNLKKDEDFFRSSVIDDLYDYIKSPSQKIQDFISVFELRTSIDEKRNWNELYTQREFRNKRNFLLLTDEKSDDVEEKRNISITLPERVSISEMKNFLNNPFIFQAKKIFNDSDSEEAEEESVQYEPVKISNLIKSPLVKDIVYKYFESNLKYAPDVLVDSEIDKLKHEASVPDGIFGFVEKEDLCKKAKGIIKNISFLKRDIWDNFGLTSTDSLPDFKFNETKTVAIEQEINNQKLRWLLSGTLSGYFWTKQQNQTILEIAEIVAGKDIRPHKDLLNPYITACMLILLKEDDEPVVVDVHVINAKERTKAIFCEGNPVSKKEALEILQNIYYQMFVEKFRKNISAALFMNDKTKAPDFDFTKYISEITNDYTWKYFNKKALFNPYTDFGISSENFTVDFNNANQIMESMIKISK